MTILTLQLGHCESFNSKKGRMLVDQLADREMIIFLAVDEVHKCLADQWGGKFRQEMLSVPAELKVAANTKAPCIAMSGTLQSGDYESVKKLLKLKKNVVIIKQNPILNNTRIVNIPRPKKSINFNGTFSEQGELIAPGS